MSMGDLSIFQDILPFLSSETCSEQYFEKINKIDKTLAKLTRGYQDSIKINKIRNEKGDITTETKEIKNNHPTTKGYTQPNWKIWMK